MNIVISGSSGLIGAAISQQLKAEGHTIVPLIRNKKDSAGVYWNIKKKILDNAALEGCDAVIHLAGENIAGVRWTRAKKKRILQSRVQGTSLLASALSSLERPPAVYISASAIGIYGERGAEIIDETSLSGSGFLAEVCQAWEEAAAPIAEAGIRTVFLRFGMVLDAKGGALAAMLPAFRFGLGGRSGDGTQYVSWISLSDAVHIALFCLRTAGISGAINAVSPVPVTNEHFVRSLAALLRRPACIPLPPWAIRILLGEMGESLLLSSCRVLPKRLLTAGFAFEHEHIEQALASMLPQQNAAVAGRI